MIRNYIRQARNIKHLIASGILIIFSKIMLPSDVIIETFNKMPADR